MSVKKASDEQVKQFIQNNDGWGLVNGKLHKDYTFLNFTQAFAFMTSVASYAEEHNHHPEWFNVYKTVKVDLVTHEASGITERDFAMATQMDVVARDKSK